MNSELPIHHGGNLAEAVTMTSDLHNMNRDVRHASPTVVPAVEAVRAQTIHMV